MDQLTIEQVKSSGWLVLECISGSRAYGLQTPQSDTDIKGVFVLPQSRFFGLEYIPQVNNATNDIVYYELRRYVELLEKNNPNMLELLTTPDDCILYRHPLMEQIAPELFLSRRCNESFAGYAMAQVRKARGLNKKVLQPEEPVRKSVLDFCYVPSGQGSIPVMHYLEENGMKQEYCGLSKIPHMQDVYGLYYNTQGLYKGIVQKDSSNEVALSSIPETEQPLIIMSFNKTGYSMHCKAYKEYQEWKQNRNPERFRQVLDNDKRYDAKNMMHTFRLLRMAEEIAREGTIHVRRKDREFLLDIKRGKYTYAELMELAEALMTTVRLAYDGSSLPQEPDTAAINEMLVLLRREFYRQVPALGL